MRKEIVLSALLALTACKNDPDETELVIDVSSATYAETDFPVVKVEVSSGANSVDVVNDENSLTYWSSASQSNSDNTEWITYEFSEAKKLNYVKILPVYSGGKAVGFPLKFEIAVQTGTTWKIIRSSENFSNPEGDWLIFPLVEEQTSQRVRVRASKLRRVGSGGFSFQLAETTAGYDPGFSHFSYRENTGAAGYSEVRNIGSGSFDPDKLANWNYDVRNPILAAVPGGHSNVYAPYIVENGDRWNVYYGGWDGTNDGHDRISLTTIDDDFLEFSNRVVNIERGEMNHVNNESVIRRSDGKWHMLYTTLPQNSAINKPCYSVSDDGIHWTPGEGNANYQVKMEGYPNWPLADVNGSNVPYFENGKYHFYFNDFNYLNSGNAFAVHYATSDDLINFKYSKDVLEEEMVAQDVRRFESGGKPSYLMVLHRNGNELRYAVGTSPANFTPSKNLLTNQNAADRYIVAAGWVTKNNRLYGVLYGAGAVPTLDRNAINAKWLQKKVIFETDLSKEQLGGTAKAYGPNRLQISMNKAIHTGKFLVYDTDGTTLLYTSPKLTIVEGDSWNYVP